MTPEDEEFNRIEMESRIKQEYVRSMKQEMVPMQAVLEMRDYIRELEWAIKELRERIVELGGSTKQAPVKMVEYICVCGKGMKFESKDGIVAPQRTWVGLTDEEIFTELERVDPETKRLPAGLKIFAHYLEARLKEKNNG